MSLLSQYTFFILGGGGGGVGVRIVYSKHVRRQNVGIVTTVSIIAVLRENRVIQTWTQSSILKRLSLLKLYCAYVASMPFLRSSFLNNGCQGPKPFALVSYI